MKVKDFFKGITFKCIVVLLAISLVAGGLLSILNDVLDVSEAEKINRVISKFYPGESVEANKIKLSESDIANSYGTIQSAYEVSDGNLLIVAVGGNGYKGGTVTVTTLVSLKDGKVEGVKAINIGEYEKQTLMSQLNKKWQDTFSTTTSNGEYFSSSVGEGLITTVVSGATMSSNATNNAVNAALKFARIRTGEEKVSNLVNADSVKNVKFTVDKANNTVEYTLTAISVSTGMPNNYDLSVKVASGKISSITVITDGVTSTYGPKVKDIKSYNGMDQEALQAFLSSGDIKTGATNSNKTIVNALIYATGNYEFFINGGTLGDDTLDAINAFYGADAGITYTEIENLDPDQAIDVEKAFELSNKDYAALVNGEYVFITNSEEPTAKNEVSKEAASAAVNFVRKYLELDATLKYNRYVSLTSKPELVGENVIYNVIAKTVAHEAPYDYSLKITVNVNTGKIVSVTDTAKKGEQFGATYGYEEFMKKLSTYKNMDEADILAFLNSAEDPKGAIHTGATNSNKTIAQALLFATANYQEYNPNKLDYQTSVKDVNVDVDGNTVKYTLTAKSVAPGTPNDYVLAIEVTEGKIAKVTVTTDGATAGFGDQVQPVSKYVGMDLENLKDPSTIKTGATNSNKTIVNALLFATANYNYFLEGGSI